ncbi:MAG TPA: DUF3761 domain-containing protein [Rhizomicrobium sp.]|jgi:hypothetical protein|nr:DUF3761 domain-containing protein [Rhizomicrobium sp.]
MRLLLASAFASFLVAPALADTMPHCTAAWQSMSAADKAKTSYRAYSSMCLKSSYKVPASGMSSGTPPAGATARCKDGTYNMSKVASGRCSGHGGVAKIL